MNGKKPYQNLITEFLIFYVLFNNKICKLVFFKWRKTFYIIYNKNLNYFFSGHSIHLHLDTSEQTNFFRNNLWPWLAYLKYSFIMVSLYRIARDQKSSFPCEKESPSKFSSKFLINVHFAAKVGYCWMEIKFSPLLTSQAKVSALSSSMAVME